MSGIENEDTSPLPGWFAPEDDHARAFERQLAREVTKGHVLEGRRLRTLWKADANDDVVFVEDGPAGPVHWLVHLTWETPVDARWPTAVRIDFPRDLLEEA